MTSPGAAESRIVQPSSNFEIPSEIDGMFSTLSFAVDSNVRQYIDQQAPATSHRIKEYLANLSLMYRKVELNGLSAWEPQRLRESLEDVHERVARQAEDIRTNTSERIAGGYTIIRTCLPYFDPDWHQDILQLFAYGFADKALYGDEYLIPEYCYTPIADRSVGVIDADLEESLQWCAVTYQDAIVKWNEAFEQHVQVSDGSSEAKDPRHATAEYLRTSLAACGEEFKGIRDSVAEWVDSYFALYPEPEHLLAGITELLTDVEQAVELLQTQHSSPVDSDLRLVQAKAANFTASEHWPERASSPEDFLGYAEECAARLEEFNAAMNRRWADYAQQVEALRQAGVPDDDPRMAWKPIRRYPQTYHSLTNQAIRDMRDLAPAMAQAAPGFEAKFAPILKRWEAAMRAAAFHKTWNP